MIQRTRFRAICETRIPRGFGVITGAFRADIDLGAGGAHGSPKMGTGATLLHDLPTNQYLLFEFGSGFERRAGSIVAFGTSFCPRLDGNGHQQRIISLFPSASTAKQAYMRAV